MWLGRKGITRKKHWREKNSTRRSPCASTERGGPNGHLETGGPCNSVIARDAAGNTATDALTVTYMPIVATNIYGIGVFRGGYWLLDRNGNGGWDGCGVDGCLPSFGMSIDLPVTGDWTGTGTTKVGVFRHGRWFPDLNGNGARDGCQTDGCVDAFGLSIDTPVTGGWQ